MNHVPGPDDIVRRELDNGVVVLVRENFSAQSVVITGMLAAGAVVEPVHGLANFTATATMRGTTTRDFTALHEMLEGIGANLRVTGGMHSISFGGKCLSEDLPALLDLLGDVLRRPAFPPNEIERLRGELLTAIKMRQENTRYMAGRLFRKLVYPPHHPYSRGLSGELETVSSFTIDDLQHFHQQHFGPAGMIIVVVGHVSAEQAVAAIERVFADWRNTDQPLPPTLPALTPLGSLQQQSVVIPGKSQADIIVGVPGPSRTASDYYAAQIANNIFGVFGMYGRLGREIREKQGLAYYSFSQLQAGPGPGAWQVVAGVDPTNVQTTVRSVRHEVERMLREPVTPDELDDSRSNLTGSLPLRLENNEGVAGVIFSMERYQLGLDYLQRYAHLINSVDADHVNQAMHHYWSPDAFALAIAGPEGAA